MFLFLASTLFVFGPSCGGKSTLSKALVQQLGPTWTYLDRDHLIQNGLCSEEKADEMIEEHILLFQSKDQNVVVDAQIPWRTQKKDELYILVYAPYPNFLPGMLKERFDCVAYPKELAMHGYM